MLAVTHLPELLASILSTDSLQDLSATWVLIHERVHLVYIIVDYYVQSLLDCVVLGDLLGGERLGHGGLMDAFRQRRRDGNGGEVLRRLKCERRSRRSRLVRDLWRDLSVKDW